MSAPIKFLVQEFLSELGEKVAKHMFEIVTGKKLLVDGGKALIDEKITGEIDDQVKLQYPEAYAEFLKSLEAAPKSEEE